MSRAKRSKAKSSIGSPLTDDEFDRLSKFLDSDPEKTSMPIEALDGFFCALIVGPELVMPSEYLPVLFGREPGNMNVFLNQRQANSVMGLIVKYWNAIVGELQAHRDYAPMLDMPDKRGVVGKAWAIGFVQGVQMRAAGWRELIESPGSEDLATIALVAGELDPDWPPRKVSRKEMDGLALMMASAVGRSYEYFLSRRTLAGKTDMDTRH